MFNRTYLSSLYFLIFVFFFGTGSLATVYGESIVDDLSLRPFVYYTSPRGLGYHSGYSSVAFLASSNQCSCFSPFVDGRLHWFDKGRSAFNVGIGGRYLLDYQQVVVGANVYYDYRNTSHKDFQQIGVGVEFLGCDWDLRANAYIPLGKTRSNIHRCVFDQFDGGFIAVSKKYHYSFWGGDAEIGTNLNWIPFINQNCFKVYTAIGSYFLNSDHHSEIWGGRYRLGVSLTDYISIEGRVTYDHTFKTRAQGVIALEIPLCNIFDIFSRTNNNCCGCNCCDRMNAPVFRNEIIPVRSHCRFDCNYNCQR